MGRATILSGGDAGRYTIELDYGTAQRDALVSKLDAKIAEMEDRAIWQQGQVDGFQGGLDSLRPEFDALVTEYVALSNAVPRDQAAMDAKRKQLDAKTAEIVKQQQWLASAEADLKMTQAAIKSAQLERGALLAAEVSETRQAWCADLTETATGAVATLEVPGESALILIQPGAPAPTASHGALTAREVQTPAQVFWNAAVLPGWQKFKPTHRWGTITALNQAADTCTVELAEAKSSAQRLNVNQATTLEAVPIRYMECHAAVFNVGDRVIVEFTGQDWTQPVVIGFVDNPRACGGAGLYCIPASDTAPYGWSPPTVDETGAPINDGKGSVATLGDAGAPAGPARDGTNRTAGVVASITSSGLGTRTIRGKRADAAGIPATGPTELGNDDHTLSFSSLGRRDFEWLSKTGAYLATAFDTVRVNGRDLGRPPEGTPYRAFVPAATLTESTATAFCLTADAGTLRLYRRPLAGGSSVAWEAVASHSVATYGTSFEQLRKIITNDDASVLTVWFCDTCTGVGCLDLAIPGGAATWTDAVTTFSKNYDPAYPLGYAPDEMTDEFTTQFSVDYVDNAKAFATITGTRRDDVGGEIEETITADFWGVSVQISHYLFEQSGVIEYWTDEDGVDRTRLDSSTYATLESRQIYWLGGAGDPILFTRKDYERTLVHSLHLEDTWLAGRCSPGDEACFIREGRDEYWRIPEIAYGCGIIHNEAQAMFSSLTRPEYEARHQLEDTYTLPTEAEGSFNKFYRTWREGEWARTERSTGGYSAEYYGTAIDVLRRFRTLFIPANAPAFYDSGYHWAASNYSDVNLRSFNGFAILSNPQPVEETHPFVETETFISILNWPPTVFQMPPDAAIGIDTSAWQTYCSDPSALARYALDLSMTPGPNRLKYLQLGSPS